MRDFLCEPIILCPAAVSRYLHGLSVEALNSPVLCDVLYCFLPPVSAALSFKHNASQSSDRAPVYNRRANARELLSG
jgi:hypothetical protein